jgi:FkbM family methyltransferase
MIDIIRRYTRPYRWLFRMLRRGAWHEQEFSYAQLHFGQFGEDCVLLSLFGKQADGFFIDVGAFHPIYFSNTYQLSKRGWTGINIEPNPESFKPFPALRPRDINLNVAVSGNSEQREFVCDGPYSGFCDGGYQEVREGIGGESGAVGGKPRVRVKAVPLRQIVTEHVPAGVRVDLLTVDCEGADLAVLESADLSAFRPRVVLVEDHTDSLESEVMRFMRRHGYVHYCRIGLTRFFLEPEFARAHGLAAAVEG